MTGHEKARLLGLLFWLFTALNLLIVVGIAVIYIALFGFVLGQAPQRPGEPDPAVIMSILIVVFVFALIVTVLFSIPKIVAGYGLRKGKPWARTWAIVASAMAAMSFPIGTGIGVFGLIFLLSDEGKRYFESVEFNSLSSAGRTPPPLNSWQ